MFVFSVKTTRWRLIGAAFVAVLLVVLAILSSRQAAAKSAAVTMTVVDDAARQQVLTSLGYELLPGKSEVREILIPAESDKAFEQYNALQIAEGYDLTEYCGKRVKCWTYTVTNYPNEDAVLAHLYVYKDRVIGGDISSATQGGFSHGLKPMLPSAA